MARKTKKSAKLLPAEKRKEIFESFLNESTSTNKEKIKKEAISRLADFFRVSRTSLQKFNFDGKDNIKELTKVLNSTNEQGTELYYKTAIKLAKEEVFADGIGNFESMYELCMELLGEHTP